MPPFLRQNRDNSQKKETSVPQSVLRSSCRYARHKHCLTGESPEQALIAGIAESKARVSIVSWNLKEAGDKYLT